jgi:hypothetical protein
MNNLNTPEAKRGTKYRHQHIHIGLVEGSSVSEVQKWDTCAQARYLTYNSPARFAMRSWRKNLPRSIVGLPNSGWITFHGKDEVSEPRRPV